MPALPAEDGQAFQTPGPPRVPNQLQSAPLLLSDGGRPVLVECSGRRDNAEEKRNDEDAGRRQRRKEKGKRKKRRRIA
jgi:hypothetical protein